METVPADGIVERRVCFHGTVPGVDRTGKPTLTEYPCFSHVVIRAVHCGVFLLWELPNVPKLPGEACPAAYCTTGARE